MCKTYTLKTTLLKKNQRDLNKQREDLNKQKGFLYSWAGRLNIIKMAIVPKLIYGFNTMPVKPKLVSLIS